MRLLGPFAAALALAACTTTANDAGGLAPAAYAGALDDSRRPAADKASDAARLPAEVLAFAQVAPGEVVGDWLMGAGYWTRLLVPAVGPNGKVYGFQADEFIGFRPAYATEQDAAVRDYPNAAKVRSPIAAAAWPEPLDTLITVQNFHDLYIGPMPPGTAAKAVKGFYDALKPGGTLVVIDHSAAPGTGSSAADGLHRIDRQFVIDTLTAAGFQLDGTADFYARADDPRTANVFDPSIRGKTDQFALRFRKPG
ncbi:class I SAM-dependent methyltransferase [Tsuneonella sp. HG222]